MAVVKADAYGHGAVEVVKYLSSLGKIKPHYYAVALAKEAVELRREGIKVPILVFDPFEQINASACIDYNLIATVFTEKHLQILKKALKNSSKKIKVHIKIDTGMNRLGIDCDKAFGFVKKVSEDKTFIIDGFYTHFATADSKDKSFALLQLKRFKELIAKLKAENIKLGIIHAANSGAILDLPETYFDMVRCGISLYGYYPSFETSESVKLKPVMSVVSKVSTVKEVKPGDTISYGRRYTVKRKSKIFTVPVGYADGYRRGLTNKGKAIVNGKLYNQVGTVTMDRIMFDAGNDNIKPGDKVILLGKEKNLSVTAWDWAKILGTIPYEITCGISKRLARVYK